MTKLFVGQVVEVYTQDERYLTIAKIIAFKPNGYVVVDHYDETFRNTEYLPHRLKPTK